MKRRFFLFSVLSCLASLAFAQWTAPKITAEDYVDLKTTSAVEGDTTWLYLYNVEGKGFLTNQKTSHSEWSTHAAVADFGNRVMIEKYEIEGEWDGKTILIKNMYNSTWYSLFAASEVNMFVDYQSDGYPVWEYSNEGKIYKFRVSEHNTTAFTDEMTPVWAKSYMGINTFDDDYLNAGVMPLTPMINVVDTEEDGGNPSAFVSWAFIGYERYQEYKAALQAYNSAVKLGTFIEETAESYPEVSLDAAKAVYTNYESTSAELDAAYAQLATDIYNYRIETILGGASKSDPRDATVFMANSNFDAGNADGWEITVGSTEAKGYQGDSYVNGEISISNFIQAWRPTWNNNSNVLGDGKIYTTVKNLPAGKYKVSCDAIAALQINGVTTEIKGVTFYVKQGDETLIDRQVSTNDQTPEHYSMTFATPAQGDVEIGIKVYKTNCSWIAADNFVLSYYGNAAEDPNLVLLEGLIERYESEYPALEDVYAYKGTKDEFAEAIKQSKAVAEADADSTQVYLDQIDALNAAYNNLATSIKDYKTLLDAIAENEEYQNVFSESFPDLATLLGDSLMVMRDAYDESTADHEYCSTIGATQYKMILDYIAANQKQGDEVTGLIYNPDFSKQDEGWTWNPKGAANVKAANINPVITAYQTTFDISQTIEGLKPGIYRLEVQGYFRPCAVADAQSEYAAGREYSDDELFGELYLNNMSVKMRNPFSDAYTGGSLGSESVQYPEEGYWIPAGSNDCATAFKDPSIYKNVCYGYVLDGKLTIGVRQTNSGRSASYSAFDNFKLFYAGVDPEAVAEVTNTLQKESDALAGQLMSAEACDNMAKALDDVKNASEDELIACIGKFFDSIEDAKASVALHAELATWADKLDTELSLADEASDEKLNAANEVAAKANTALSTGCETDAACNALITEIGKAITSFKLPDGVATPDEPLNYTAVIANADFSENTGNSDKKAPGWVHGSLNGYKSNTLSTFGNTNYVRQDLAGLPAGQYQLVCVGMYRAGDANGDWKLWSQEPHDAYDYVMLTAVTSDSTYQTPVARAASLAYLGKVSPSANKVYTDEDGNDYYIAYSTGSCVEYFKAGYFRNVLNFTLPEDGRVRIGVEKDKYVSSDYMNLDRFELYYLGNTETPTAIDVIEVAKSAKGIYNLAGQKLSAPVKGLNIIDGQKYIVK